MSADTEVNSLLADDHIQVHRAFENLQDAVTKNKPMLSQQLLFHLFKSGLLRHLHWEERVLFPLYVEITKHIHCPTQIMRVQHKEIIELLDGIESQQVKGFKLQDVNALGEYLTKHNQYEETVLYPAIDELSHGMMKEKIQAVMSRGFK